MEMVMTLLVRRGALIFITSLVGGATLLLVAEKIWGVKDKTMRKGPKENEKG